MDKFVSTLLKWSKVNYSSYPWRKSDNLYHVLVSEFMLHRTQARQVLPIYLSFIKKYPELADVASARRVELRRFLAPLGLSWRINKMIDGLKQINLQYGQIPEKYEDLVAIEGIGPYIAGATLCFGRGQPQVLIDANTVRVIGRFQGLDLSGEARRRKEVLDAMQKVVQKSGKNIRDVYYSIIDFAHKLCKPVNPLCNHCPLLELGCRFGNLHS